MEDLQRRSSWRDWHSATERQVRFSPRIPIRAMVRLKLPRGAIILTFHAGKLPPKSLKSRMATLAALSLTTSQLATIHCMLICVVCSLTSFSHAAHRFEEVFVGCGQDKIVHFTELMRAGYRSVDCLWWLLTNARIGFMVCPIRSLFTWIRPVWVPRGARALIRWVLTEDGELKTDT